MQAQPISRAGIWVRRCIYHRVSRGRAELVRGIPRVGCIGEPSDGTA